MAAAIPPSFSPARRWKIGFDVVARTFLVLAVVVMVNYLGGKFYGRFYLSSQTQLKLFAHVERDPFHHEPGDRDGLL